MWLKRMVREKQFQIKVKFQINRLLRKQNHFSKTKSINSPSTLSLILSSYYTRLRNQSISSTTKEYDKSWWFLSGRRRASWSMKIIKIKRMMMNTWLRSEIRNWDTILKWRSKHCWQIIHRLTMKLRKNKPKFNLLEG